MCLPLKFLRQITRFIVYIISGFGLVIFTISLFMPSTLFFGACMGCYLQSIALCGYRGQKTRNILCMFCFNCQLWCTYIIVFIFTAIVIGLSVYLEIQAMKVQITIAETQLCQTDCECYISPEVEWPINYLQNYTYNTQNPLYAQKYQQCPLYSKDDSQMTQYLEKMEYDQQCSGISNKSAIYLFSNVSRGIPHAKCDATTFLASQYTLYLVIYGIVLLFFVSMCLLSCCICCNPSQRQNERIYPYIKYKYGDFELGQYKLTN